VGGSAAVSQAGAFKLATAAAVEKCGIMGDVKNTQIPNQMIRAGGSVGGDHDNLHSEGPLTFQSSAQLTVVPFVPG
jgi:hypothetical protein